MANNTLIPLKVNIPARIEMAEWLEDYAPLPISGGWGYSADDAVIIETDDTGIAIPLEYDFLEHRTMIELALNYEPRCDIIAYRPLKQSVHIISDKHYDRIEGEVTVRWDGDDSDTVYHVEAWYNVDKLFEGYSALLEDSEDGDD